MLHFAYGANMSRAVMRRHAAAAHPIGVARLAGYRFVITADGYASVEPVRVQSVYGVLWRLTARDRVTLDAWENISGRLYSAVTLPVHCSGRRRSALVYIARSSREGRAKPGYVELVVAAARQWELPQPYIVSLQQWLPARPRGTNARKLGEFG